MSEPLLFCRWGIVRTSSPGTSATPPRILIEKGPNSSIEKNFSFGASCERASVIFASFSPLYSRRVAWRSCDATAGIQIYAILFSLCPLANRTRIETPLKRQEKSSDDQGPSTFPFSRDGVYRVIDGLQTTSLSDSKEVSQCRHVRKANTISLQSEVFVQSSRQFWKCWHPPNYSAGQLQLLSRRNSRQRKSIWSK